MTSTLGKSIVCSRKVDFTSIIRTKLLSTFHGNAATHYGRDNEPVAIAIYTCQCKKGAPNIVVKSPGLACY